MTAAPKITPDNFLFTEEEWEAQAATSDRPVIEGQGQAEDHLAVIDDPIKSIEDADSKLMRERLWAWYQSSLPAAAKGAGLSSWHRTEQATDEPAAQPAMAERAPPDQIPAGLPEGHRGKLKMKTLSVCKADPLGREPVEGALIEIINAPIPENRDGDFYEDEALKVVEGLLQLPQATLERVLRLLLEKYAGSFRGPVTPNKETL